MNEMSCEPLPFYGRRPSVRRVSGDGEDRLKLFVCSHVFSPLRRKGAHLVTAAVWRTKLGSWGKGEQYVGASWPAALALDSASVRLDNADKQISLLARQNAPLPLTRFRGVVLSQLVIKATCWAP
jgi:hypothetical protein